MDDRELSGLREIGEANRVTLELLRNWCAHAKVVTEGGVGLFQQVTGLPISMCRVTCEHERAGSQTSMHLKENALDFYDRNCFDCKHRVPVGFPNLSFLVGERDRERQARDQRAEEKRRQKEEELAARCRERESLFEAPTSAQRSLVELLDELDRSPSEATEHAFLEALRAVPDQVTDRFRDSIAEVAVAGGRERTRGGLLALEQLEFDTVELARLALGAISRDEAVEEAAEIAARHLTSEHREEIESLAGAILLLAEPMIGSVFDRFQSSHPDLLLRANSVAPEVVRAAIEGALASEGKGIRSAGGSAIAVLMAANAETRAAGSLAESLVRSLPLPDDHYDGGSAAARASWLLAELLRRSPDSVERVLRAHLEDPQDAIRCGVFQALIDLFRPRDLATGRIASGERDIHETPEPVEEFAFGLIIEVVSRIPTDDRLSRSIEFFRAQRLERVGEAARRDSPKVQPWQQLFDTLGSAQVARDDLRLEAKLFSLPGLTIPDSRNPDGDAADARLDLPLRQVAVADQAPLLSLYLELCQEALDLGLEGLSEQPASSAANHFGQCIPARVCSSKLDDGTLLHGGVSLPSWVNLYSKIQDTPPLSSPAVHKFRP